MDFLKSERFRVTLEAVTGNAECLPLAKEMDAYYLDYLSSLPLLVPDAKIYSGVPEKQGLQGHRYLSQRD